MVYIKLEPFEASKPTRVLNDDQKFYKRFKPHIDSSLGSVIKSMEFNPIRPWEVALTSGTKMEVISVKSENVLMRISNFKDYAQNASYRHDGKLMVCTDASGLVQIVDMTNKKILRKLRGHEESVAVARFGGISSVLSGGQDKMLKLWDIAEGKTVSSVEGHSDYVQAMRVSPLSEHTWITGGYDKLIKVWDSRIGTAEGFKSVMQFDHGHGVEDLVIMPSGLMCMSAGGTAVKTWDLATGKFLSEFNHHSKAVTSLSLNPDSSAVLTSSLDGSLKVTALADHQVLGSYSTKQKSPALCTSWSADQFIFGAGMQDGSWITRKNKMAAAQPRKKKEKFYKRGTVAFFRRGGRAEPQEGDHVVKSEKPKLAHQDFLFRRFEYKKLMDQVVSGDISMLFGLSIVDRLSQQGGLEYALSERQDEDCKKILHWCNKALRQNVAFHPLVREVIFSVLENECIQEPSPSLLVLLQNLNKAISSEIVMQSNLVPVKGLLDLIMQ